jgi:hypothetical protein
VRIVKGQKHPDEMHRGMPAPPDQNTQAARISSWQQITGELETSTSPLARFVSNQTDDGTVWKENDSTTSGC